jgi:bifunctional non-homologous end joining protein LigD
MALEEYRRKRDFRRTPEPSGAPRRKPAAGPRFVVQQHAARRLHYDFRLELDGVLKSWAIPKGPSLDPGEKRLAVEVEDHPLDYGDFEGVIPKGEYGGGTVLLWDRGSWTPAEPDPAAALRDGKLKFALDGEKLHGGWMLVRLPKKPRDRHENWLLIKERDAAAQPDSGDAAVVDNPLSVASGRSLAAIADDRDRVWHSGKGESQIAGARRGPLPDRLKPQIATLAAEAPEGPEWLHEIKHDGYRLLARIDHGKVRLITRNGLDWTDKFPELAAGFAALSVETALIDGELVCCAADGRTSFSGLQEAIAAGDTEGLLFYAFDLLYRDGWDLTPAALQDRKAALAELIAPQAQDRLRYSDHHFGGGAEFLRHAREYKVEGIVSKRRDRPYRAGRSDAWRKVKCLDRDEFIVIGYTDPEGRREGFGALLLGCYDPAGTLRYAGRAGTGFDTALLGDLRRRLDALARARPLAGLPDSAPKKAAHWVEPRLVAEIEFAGRTTDGVLWHPAFLGLREDKQAAEVVCASAPNAPAPPEPARDGSIMFAGVRLSHPDRPLWPEDGISKLDLARYWEAVAQWALPQLADRPLTLVRRPRSGGNRSFYQKHLIPGMPKVIRGVELAEDGGTGTFLAIDDLAGLIALVQMDAIEIHPWGARAGKVDQPDRVTFDLDPDEGLPWPRTVEAALVVREALSGIGLDSFVKTTGGKGLHVVVPLMPKLGWDRIKAFSRWVAERLSAQSPDWFTANQQKRARQGRIYIDYLRNSRGATAVGAYSPRLRPGAPVSTPLSWEELEEGAQPASFTVATVPARLAGLKSDPWVAIGTVRQSLGAAVLRHIGN